MDETKVTIQHSTFHFAIRVVKLYQYLTNDKKEYVLSKQLLRSGTSVGALVREAQNAESKMDFIHKLGVAQKECDESMYWLELLKETHFLNENEFRSIHHEATIILKMIRSAIITVKKKLNS